MSHGLQLDFSYTFSKSIDMGSDAERTTLTGRVTAFSEIIDPWHRKGTAQYPISILLTLSLLIGFMNYPLAKARPSHQMQQVS